MALRDQLTPVIKQVRQLIKVNPSEAHRKANTLLRWASKEPFTNDQLHNLQRFLLIEETKALRLEAALALQGHTPNATPPPSPPQPPSGSTIIKLPR
jgi:hypothetical protein